MEENTVVTFTEEQQCYYCGEFWPKDLFFFCWGVNEPAACWPCGADAHKAGELPEQQMDQEVLG